jgi:hypothetical protein
MVDAVVKRGPDSSTRSLHARALGYVWRLSKASQAELKTGCWSPDLTGRGNRFRLKLWCKVYTLALGMDALPRESRWSKTFTAIACLPIQCPLHFALLSLPDSPLLVVPVSEEHYRQQMLRRYYFGIRLATSTIICALEFWTSHVNSCLREGCVTPVYSWQPRTLVWEKW